MHRLLIVLCLLLIAGCGPVVKVTNKEAYGSISSIAILPIQVEGTVPQESVKAFSESFNAAMRTRGYRVLDPRIILSVCGNDSACPKREQLFRTGVTTLLNVSLGSSYRANLGLAFFNKVHAKVTLLGPSGEIGEVTTSQSEQGGILVQSGQVVEGVLSTVREFRESPYTRLLQKLAEKTAEALPPPSYRAGSEEKIQLKAITATVLGRGRHEVCVESENASLVTVKFPTGQESPLRKRKNGRYCGSFFIGNKPSAAVLRAHASFGAIAEQKISLGAQAQCEVKNLDNNKFSTLQFACNQDNKEKNLGQGHEEERAIIFTGNKGTFIRLAEISPGKTFRVQKEKSPFEVLTIGSDGSISPLQEIR